MEQKTNRELALSWWNEMSFEQQFYTTIKNNDIIVGDKTRHPHTLTGREIESIWFKEMEEVENRAIQELEWNNHN